MSPVLLTCSLIVSAITFVAPERAHADNVPLVIDIRVDEARIVRLPTDAVTVILGNPLIADVTVEGPRLLVATGKAAGRTNIVVLGAGGAEILKGSLSVSMEAAGTVFLYHGQKRQSLYCAPLCERSISAGDDAQSFGETISAHTKKQAGSAPAASRPGSE